MKLRFKGHWTTALVLLGGAFSAQAATQVVLGADIPIPSTFGGVYLDLTNNATASATQSGAADPAGDSYTVSFSQPASGDWDFNFFFGGIGIAHNTTANPYRNDAADHLSAIHALGIGEDIDGTTATPSGALPLSTPSFGGSGTGSGGGSGVSTSGNHIGNGANQFEPNTSEYLGFVLDPGTPEQTFGWMRVTFQDDGSAGTIHDFALSDTPIAVGIPEPSAVLLTALGTLALTRRKRT